MFKLVINLAVLLEFGRQFIQTAVLYLSFSKCFLPDGRVKYIQL